MKVVTNEDLLNDTKDKLKEIVESMWEGDKYVRVVSCVDGLVIVELHPETDDFEDFYVTVTTASDYKRELICIGKMEDGKYED